MKKTKKMLFLELNLMDYLMKTFKKSMKFIYPHAINSFKTGDEAERKNLGEGQYWTMTGAMLGYDIQRSVLTLTVME